MKGLNMRALTHVALMAGAAAGVMALTGPVHDAEAHGPEEARLNLDGGLLTTNRDSLRLCLELAPEVRARRADITQRLDTSLQRIQGHPDWAKARYGQGPFRVEQGCPGAALPERALDRGSVAGPGPTKAPSPFRTFVYVLDDATADRVLGERDVARAPAELLPVDEHVIVEVSTAVVVRESYLASADFTDFWLTWGIGLQPARGLAFQPLNETVSKYPDGQAPTGMERRK